MLRLDSLRTISLVAAAIVTVLVVTPLIWLFFGSFWSGSPGAPGEFTTANYRNVYAEPLLYEALLNSATFAIGSTLVALGLGTPLAWIVTRTNTPFRRFFEVMALVPYMIPGILFAIGWAFLLSPRAGIINATLVRTLGLSGPPFNVFTLPGMIWVDGLTGIPLVFILVSAAFKNQDASLEEAARVSGSSHWRTFARISLPIMRPALLAATTLSLVRYIELFEVPAIIGLPAGIYLLTTLIFRQVAQHPPNYGAGTASAVTLLIFTVGLVYAYRTLTKRSERFATLTGKGVRVGVLDLGRWRYLTLAYCLLLLLGTAALPMVILTLGSVLPYWGILSLEGWEKSFAGITLNHYTFALNLSIVQRAFANSIILALLGATLAMALTATVGYLTTRLKTKASGLLEFVTFLPFAIPGLVMAVGFLWAYITLPIFGTIWLLLIAYITRFMPYGLRATTSTVIQIHTDLEDASRIAGASWLKTFRHVVIPLIKPGLVAGWIFLSIIFLREVSASVLLYKSGSEVLAVVVYALYNDNQWEAVAAIGVIMTGITLILSITALKLTGTRGVAL